MLKKGMLGAAFALLVAGAGAFAQKQQVMLDKVVAVVGSSSILHSEVAEYARQLTAQRRAEGYTSDRDPMNEALEALMTQKLLYNQAQIDSGELTGEALTNAKAALSNAYLDGVLSVFFLVMMGVFVVVGIVVVARTFAAGKYGAETTSEEPFVESQWFAPSSLVATALEKKVQREYSAKLHALLRNRHVAA